MGPSRRVSKCPEVSASFSNLVRKVPDLPDGGHRVNYIPDGLYRFGASRTFAAWKAVTFGDAKNSNLADPK